MVKGIRPNRPPALLRLSPLFLALCLAHLPMGEARADAAAEVMARAKKQSVAEAVASLEGAASKIKRPTAKDAELFAQLSMTYSTAVDAHNRRKEKAEAKLAAENAVEAAKQAVKLNERLADGHLALAIAYGKLAGFMDNRTKLQFSRVIYNEAHRTLELNPKKDLAHHILGRWHLSIGTLSPFKRFAARTAYGDIPEGSLKTGIDHLQKAVALNPTYAPHHRRLAEALEADGRKKEARPHWEKVLTLPVHDDEDRRAHRAAKKALGK